LHRSSARVSFSQCAPRFWSSRWLRRQHWPQRDRRNRALPPRARFPARHPRTLPCATGPAGECGWATAPRLIAYGRPARTGSLGFIAGPALTDTRWITKTLNFRRTSSVHGKRELATRYGQTLKCARSNPSAPASCKPPASNRRRISLCRNPSEGWQPIPPFPKRSVGHPSAPSH